MGQHTQRDDAVFELPPLREKLDLLAAAHGATAFRSFADLGACWGVHGAYADHAVQLCGDRLKRAVIVDGVVTSLTRDRADARVEIVPALLGSEEALAAVGEVDALIMFDILVHQVDPDWDVFLRSWLRRTDVLVLWNHHWLAEPRSFRLIDRGFDWYAKNAYGFGSPLDDSGDAHEDPMSLSALRCWFDRHGERDEWGRLERDAHHYWQWGITLEDLRALLRQERFEEIHFERHPFSSKLPQIVCDGMVFRRRRLVSVVAGAVRRFGARNRP
ncbi:MAG: hypothetical protein F4X59_17495 [Holophagales bacterium]|nr:hypothetical protein [Holophagales bacterium]